LAKYRDELQDMRTVKLKERPALTGSAE